MNYHIYPTNDLRKHNTESEYCECKPRIEIQKSGDKLVIHDAWDGRQIVEDKEFNMN